MNQTLLYSATAYEVTGLLQISHNSLWLHENDIMLLICVNSSKKHFVFISRMKAHPFCPTKISLNHIEWDPYLVTCCVCTDPWMPAGALALAAHADSMAIS